MRPVKWFLIFFSFVLLTCLFAAGFNAAADPFGVFGDPFFDWYAYNMTNNPRAAKIAYLDRNHDKYDSYIIGCSKTSSFSAERLNGYFPGARFYNMLMYGGDMYDIEATALYILENYPVKNIIINIGIEEPRKFGVSDDPIKGNLHYKTDGSSALSFYFKYLFMNPQYSFDKIEAFRNRGYLITPATVFIPETGVYNKMIRDAAPISSLSQYLEENPGFLEEQGEFTLEYIDECVQAVQTIKERCERAGVSFMLIASPVYKTELRAYDPEELRAYWYALSQVTDFWDFSGYSPISFEPRYFYDANHFRNSVGDMALAYIFGDSEVYVPDGFGHYTTADNVQARAEEIFTPPALPVSPAEYEAVIPALIYHHFDENPQSEATMTPEAFERQMTAIKNAGYTAVSIEDLLLFVRHGHPLPDKPVIITMDDGYTSNYDIAFPVLERLSMRGVIFMIGAFADSDTYKDTGHPIIPHFSAGQAREMIASGVIEIGSHTYDMHQTESLERDYRRGVYSKKGESEDAYIRAFRDDFFRFQEEFAAPLGLPPAFAYPYGNKTVLSDVLLSELGVRVTFTTQPVRNTVLKGLPQSLYSLGRKEPTEKTTDEELIKMLERE